MSLKKLISTSRPCAIPSLALPGDLKILVLAPHPDDFDAIGVTMRFFFRNGNPLFLGVAQTGSGVDDDYSPGATLADKADIREREQRRSLDFFGLPNDAFRFLRMENDSEDQPVDCHANLEQIEALMAEKTPDMVFLPHGNDTNAGHRAMNSLFKQAAGRCARPIAGLLNRDPKTIDMRTDLFMPFGEEDAAWKGALLRFHDSQHQRNLATRGYGLDDRILNFNMKTSRELSLEHKYAEAFELTCNIETSDGARDTN